MSQSRKGDALDTDDITQMPVAHETNKGAANAFLVPEILVMILELAVRNFVEDTIHENINSEQFNTSAYPPWSFLLVCKHWHQVVMSTPTLWSNFFLYSSRVSESVDENTRMKNLSSLLDVYLRRSKTAPLTFTYILLGDNWANFVALWERMLSSQHRWQNVTLLIGRDYESSIAPTKYTLRLCELKTVEKLSVTLTGGEFCFIDIELGPCPSLKELDFSGGSCFREGGHSVQETEVFFPNLRSADLKLDLYDLGEVGKLVSWPLLRHCQNVQHLKIAYPSFHAEPVAVPLELPNLQSLELFSSCQCNRNLLQCFTIPPTTRLNVTNYTTDSLSETFSAYSTAFQNVIVEDLTFSVVLPYLEITTIDEEVSRAFLHSCAVLRSLNFTVDPSLYSSLCMALSCLFAFALPVRSDSSQDQHRALAHPKLLKIEILWFLAQSDEEIDFACVRELVSTCQGLICDSDFRLELSFRGAVDSELPTNLRRELQDLCNDDTIQMGLDGNYFKIVVSNDSGQ